MNLNYPKMVKRISIIRQISLIVVALSIFSTTYSQLWTRYRTEIFFGGGASQMLSDLGGGPEAGRNDIRDMDLEATNYAATVGVRYKISDYVSGRLSFSYLQTLASDEYTENPGRSIRNLSARTNIFEFSPMIEFYLLKENIPMNKTLGRRYRHYGQGGDFSIYVATGFTTLYFNPQAQLNGTWHDLQPLGTEGQGLETGNGKYSRFTFGLPIGIGFKYSMTRHWSISLEGQARFTATDYLDDVSTDYYDNQEIREAYGPVAAELANRRLDGGGGEGGIRGNPENNDVYMFLEFHLSRRFDSSKRRGGIRRSF
jgi:opacity protein-like surface antigen